MEVDITTKAIRFLQFSLLGIFGLAALTIGGIWLYKQSYHDVILENVQVKSALVPVKAKADGVIAEIFVADGAQVKAGDRIARIKVLIYDEDIVKLQQNVTLAKQSLENLQKGIAITEPIVSETPTTVIDQEAARARMERMKELYEMGAISAVKRDEAEAAYKAAVAASAQEHEPITTYHTIMQPASKEQIKQAELFLKQAEIALAKAQQERIGTEIIAPVTGVLYLAEGIGVEGNISNGQTFANIGNIEDLWLEAVLNSSQKEQVRLGQFASYHLGEQEVQGTVQKIEDPDTNNGESRVRISVPKEVREQALLAAKLTVRLSP